MKVTKQYILSLLAGLIFGFVAATSSVVAVGQEMVTSLPASAYAAVEVPAELADPVLPAVEHANDEAMSDEELNAIFEALAAAAEIGSYAVDKWGESSNTTRAAILFLMLWIFAPWIVRATPTKWDDKLLAYEGVLGGVRAFLWRVATLRPAKKPDNSTSLS